MKMIKVGDTELHDAMDRRNSGTANYFYDKILGDFGPGRYGEPLWFLVLMLLCVHGKLTKRKIVQLLIDDGYVYTEQAVYAILVHMMNPEEANHPCKRHIGLTCVWSVEKCGGVKSRRIKGSLEKEYYLGKPSETLTKFKEKVEDIREAHRKDRIQKWNSGQIVIENGKVIEKNS